MVKTRKPKEDTLWSENAPTIKGWGPKKLPPMPDKPELPRRHSVLGKDKKSPPKGS